MPDTAAQPTPLTFTVEAQHATALRKSKSITERNYWLFDAAGQALFLAHREADNLGIDLHTTRIEFTFEDMNAVATLHLPPA